MNFTYNPFQSKSTMKSTAKHKNAFCQTHGNVDFIQLIMLEVHFKLFQLNGIDTSRVIKDVSLFY